MSSRFAYVFWHWPRAEIGRETYEKKLAQFLTSMKMSKSHGLLDVGSFRVDHLPWVPSNTSVYEDWYIVDSFAALGELNDAATTGETRNPHDSIAKDYMKGAGGVFKWISGEFDLQDAKYANWIEKSIGPSYQSYYDDVARSVGRIRSDLWRRQMVLGPSSQFVLHSRQPIDLPQNLKPVSSRLVRINSG